MIKKRRGGEVLGRSACGGDGPNWAPKGALPDRGREGGRESGGGGGLVVAPGSGGLGKQIASGEEGAAMSAP